MCQDLKAWREVSLCDFDLLYLVHDLICKSNDLGKSDIWIVEKDKLSFKDLYTSSTQQRHVYTLVQIQNYVYVGFPWYKSVCT